MPGILMNVGSNAIAAAGASAGGGGGQTLGAAQGSITINVNNVTQANSILQQSARQMQQAFAATGSAARLASIQQIAAARTAAAQAASASQQTIASNKANISSLSLLSAQQNQQVNAAINLAKQQTQAARTTQAQQQQVYRQTSQAISLSYQQQSQAARLAGQAAAQGATTARNAVNQQIAQNRLLISNINLQSAAARAAAAAQRRAAQQTQTAWQAASGAISKIRTELLLISGGAGLIVGAGIRYAASLQDARIQLSGIVGGLNRGNELTEDLQKKGRQAGIPFQDMLTFATQLLPVLNKDTKELDRWFDITRRVAVLNRGPTGGLQGAAFSLREAFLSVQQGGKDFVSLADRFNISKKALQDALEISGGDFVKAIDIVLTKMGITTELADQMAKSFNASFAVARDAALQLVAAGFGPLLESIGGALRGAADWLTLFSESNPEIVAMGAGLLTLVVAIGPLIVLINNLTIAWAALGATAQATILKMAGLAGATVAAYGLGKTIGLGIGGAIRQSKGQSPLTNDQVNQNAKDALFNVFATIRQGTVFVAKAVYGLGIAIIEATASFHRMMADTFSRLAESTNIPALKGFLEERSKSENISAFNLDNAANAGRAELNRQIERILGDVIAFAKNIGVTGFQPEDATSKLQQVGKYTQEQVDRMVEYSADVAALTRQTNSELMAENRSYSRQRLELERNFAKQIKREDEDIARQRLRDERNLQKSIQDVSEDSMRQRAKWFADLERSIGQAREDSAERVADITEEHNDRVENAENDSKKKLQKLQEDNDQKIEKSRQDSIEKLAKLEKDFNRDRIRSQEEYKKNLFSAAAQFDAFAIAREEAEYADKQKREREDQKERLAAERNSFSDLLLERKESYDQAVKEEKDNLAERLQEEQKSYDKRLSEESESLEKSILQQRESFALKLKEQQEDDALRIKELRDQFSQQRAEQEEDRRIQRERAFFDHNEQLAEMDRVHGERILQIESQAKAERDKLDEEFKTEIDALGLRIAGHREKMKGYEDNAIKAFDNVWGHMLTALNAPLMGPQPAPLNPYVLQNQQGLPPSLLGGGSGGGVGNVIGDNNLTVNIYPSPNQSPAEIGTAVIDQYFKKLAPGYIH